MDNPALATRLTPNWKSKSTVTGTAALCGLSLIAGMTLRPGHAISSAPPAADVAPPPAIAQVSNPAPLDPRDPNIFVNLAKKVIPSVVNISTLTAVKPVAMRGGGFRTPEDMFEELFRGGGGRMFHGGPQGPGDSDGMQGPRTGSLGTGFIIDATGIIMTNHHVVAGADEIKISFTESPDEKPTVGKVIARDPELDVALIKVKTDRQLQPLVLGDSEILQVGEYVAAVGNPFGQGHSFTHGLISAKGRHSPGVPLATYLQTDAPINPGNSGGPLINLRGEVIGINNAIDARAQGIGFAIPINVVKAVLPTLESHGIIARGYIGAMVSDLSPELAEKLNAPKNLQAPLVMQVAPGGPAYRAGIRPYDVITEFNGKPVHSASDLTSQVVALPEGQTVPVRISRADRELQIKIQLGKRPDPQRES